MIAACNRVCHLYRKITHPLFFWCEKQQQKKVGGVKHCELNCKREKLQGLSKSFSKLAFFLLFLKVVSSAFIRVEDIVRPKAALFCAH